MASVKRALPTPLEIPTKRSRSSSQIKSDRQRSKTRINIGPKAFVYRWRKIMTEKNLRFDAQLANFLLDWYEKSSSFQKEIHVNEPHIDSDEKETWSSPDTRRKKRVKTLLDKLEWSLSEEEEDLHLSTSIFNTSEDTKSHHKQQSYGEELGQNTDAESVECNWSDSDDVSEIGVDEEVHSIPEHINTVSLSEADMEDNYSSGMSVEATVHEKAAIAYNVSVKFLADLVVVPVQLCPFQTAKKTICGHQPPFRAHISNKGTACVIHWEATTIRNQMLGWIYHIEASFYNCIICNFFGFIWFCHYHKADEQALHYRVTKNKLFVSTLTEKRNISCLKRVHNDLYLPACFTFTSSLFHGQSSISHLIILNWTLYFCNKYALI